MPWSTIEPGRIIGEIWFERPGQPIAETSLLLELLFTCQPLSIQVHPNDTVAHSMGLPRGKAEAWYVLSAAPGAKRARGLAEPMTLGELRAAVVAEAVFLEQDRVLIMPGVVGMTALVGTLAAAPPDDWLIDVTSSQRIKVPA